MTGTECHVFGYGSLVNRRTHAADFARTMRVCGWRRAWVHTAHRPVAFLSAVPAPGAWIDGLAAPVPGGDWAALDAREYAYDRHPVTQSDPPLPGLQIYAVPDRHRTAPSEAYPILLSYLDVVVQGFLHEYGPAGIDRFAATTDGWNSPVLNDRAAPRYPRAQALTPPETALTDALIAASGAWLIEDDGRPLGP